MTKGGAASYRKGAAFEREVIAFLEGHGYSAYRTAGSHGVVDVIAFGPGGIPTIQCRKVYALSREERRSLLQLAMFSDVVPLVAYKRKRSERGPGTVRFRYILAESHEDWEWEP